MKALDYTLVIGKPRITDDKNFQCTVYSMLPLLNCADSHGKLARSFVSQHVYARKMEILAHGLSLLSVTWLISISVIINR
jgi:hypothetical protein